MVFSMIVYSGIDSLKSFSNHYQITNRKLGAGGTGEVFMAIDVWNRCQVACKAVNLIKSKAKRPEVQPQPNTALEKGWHVKLWREVELLKRISHVGSNISSLIVLI